MADQFRAPAPLQTAVLFLVFNRPETTIMVFEVIRKAKPPRLYIAADGPREEREGEAEKVNKVREIATNVDWPCEVRTLFREDNLGCRHAPCDAISWFFDQEEQGIILEDDCLPDHSFFWYCEALLNQYQNDTRIGMISGNNFQFGEKRGEASYYFSRYGHIWGWATWRRAWKHYDEEIPCWPEMRDGGWLDGFIREKKEHKYWTQVLNRVHADDIDCWDYQWILNLWVQNMMSITPSVNLVSNIGFGPDGTHTLTINKFANMKTVPIDLPLKTPAIFMPHFMADRLTGRTTFSVLSFTQRVINKLKKLGRKI